jgi:hypothetical protein
MVTRGVLALAVLAGLAGPAAAGGFGCGGACYRETTLPPVYGTLADPVLLAPPRSYEIVAPARYRTFAEPVQVAPARREWRVTRDAWGRRIGCWVETPASYALRHRTVMVEAASVVPVTTYPVHGVRYRSVQLAPARRAWVPRDYAAFVEAGFPGY